MTYKATQSPTGVENKADEADSFYIPPVQDNFSDTIEFGEASWSFRDSDNSSGPASFPNPDALLSTPIASSFHKPRFLSEVPTMPPPTSTLAYPDLLSHSGQASCGIKQDGVPGSDSGSGGQSQASYTDEQDTSPPFSHSPSPPAAVAVQDTPFRSISDTELLKIEGITLHTTPRILSHSTPTSPTVTRQSGDVFDIFSSDMDTVSAGQVSGLPVTDSCNTEISRGRLAVPRAPFRTQSTNGVSTPTSKKAVTESSFVRGPIENPFGNPNTAPMPPPREPKTVHKQAMPSLQMGIINDGMGHMGDIEGLPKTPEPPMPSLVDGFPWGVPGMSAAFPSVEKVEDPRDWQGRLLENESFAGPTAAVQTATLNFAKVTDDFEHPGCEGYSHNTDSDCLMPGPMMYQSVSRPRSQTTGMLNLPYSSPMVSQPTSLPSTPAQRPLRTPSVNSRQMTPMSSPLRKVHTIRGVSTSPSPARGRLRVGEHGAARSASTAGDSSVRKRRSSSRREARMPLSLNKGGFVNFTAQDSQTLMMGVAPSGSSKTKAKREREEHERRRRLEEAAMKAVEAAGGNVQFLAEASLIDA